MIMVSRSYIREQAARYRAQVGGDPYALSEAWGIIVLREPMGEQPRSCKGFYLCQSRQRVIVLNSQLDEAWQRAVLAHELGHALLHGDVRETRAFHEFSPYDAASQDEADADCFAAELLLSDESVLRAGAEGGDLLSVASLLGVPSELLALKWRDMEQRGLLHARP